jgi:hypothetical protein
MSFFRWHNERRTSKIASLSGTTKDEDICKAVRQVLLEIVAGWSKDVWAPSKAPFHCIQRHQALAARQSEESGATDDEYGGRRGEGGLIISRFLGRLVFDSLGRFLIKWTHIITY